VVKFVMFHLTNLYSVHKLSDVLSILISNIWFVRRVISSYNYVKMSHL
jgi:hypothetical protein